MAQVEALRRIDPADAADKLRRCADLGPDSAETLASCGAAIAVRVQGAEGVMVLQRVGATLWIAAAQAPSGGPTFADAGFPLVEDIARRIGCTRVGFYTRRPGLARKAIRAGWRAELTKDLQP